MFKCTPSPAKSTPYDGFPCSYSKNESRSMSNNRWWRTNACSPWTGNDKIRLSYIKQAFPGMCDGCYFVGHSYGQVMTAVVSLLVAQHKTGRGP